MCKWSVCIARGCSRLWLRDCGVASSSNTRENGGTESGCTAATFLPCVYIMLSSPRISFMYPNGDGAGIGASASAPSPFVSLPAIVLFLFSLARLKWILPSGNYLAHNSNKNREGEREKRMGKCIWICWVRCINTTIVGILICILFWLLDNPNWDRSCRKYVKILY